MRSFFPYYVIFSLLLDIEFYSNNNMSYFNSNTDIKVKQIVEKKKRLTLYKKKRIFFKTGMLEEYNRPYFNIKYIYDTIQYELSENKNILFLVIENTLDNTIIGKTKKLCDTSIHSYTHLQDYTYYQIIRRSIFQTDTMKILNLFKIDSTGKIITYEFIRNCTRTVFPDTFQSIDSFKYANDTIFVYHYESDNNTPLSLHSKTICIYKNNTITDKLFWYKKNVGPSCYDESLSKVHIKYNGHDKHGNWTRSYFISNGKRKFRSKRKISYCE